MAISLVLVIFFTIVILFEMYFLGKYISITQEIFNNKTFAIFTMGAMVYLFTSFLVIFPFIFLNIQILYFSIILIIKDFFTIIFLVARREKFKGMKNSYSEIFFMFFGAALIILFYQFLQKYIFEIKPLVKNDHRVWFTAMSSIKEITISQSANYSRYIFYTISAVISYCSITSIYLNFSKRQNIIDYTFTIFLTIGLIILFNFNLGCENIFAIFIVVFMTYLAYNIVIFSRRRYGSFFGISTIVAWGVFEKTFWPTLILASAASLTYILLKRPKAPLFSIQMFSPILIISTLKVSDFSNILAWILFSFGILMYMLIFLFGRINFIEKTNKIFDILNFIIPILVISLIYIAGIILEMKNHTIPLKDVYINYSIFDKFTKFTNNSDVMNIVQNVLYYVLAAILIGTSLFFVVLRQKIVKWKLLVILSCFALLVGFNPAFKIILTNSGMAEEFELIQITVVIPMIIVIATILRRIIMKKRVKTIIY